MKEVSTKILNLLSEHRTAPFRSLCESDEEALILYCRALRLGQTLLGPLGITEVTVRNALDRALSDWWKENSGQGTWIDASPENAPIFLSSFVHTNEWRKRAKSSKQNHNAKITHDDIIAHTSLGTWRNMIGNPAGLPARLPLTPDKVNSWEAARRQDALCAELWKHATKNAFPFIPQTKGQRLGLSPRAYVGLRLSRISYLRNRVCHWDSLLSVDTATRYDDMKRVVRAIDADLEEWLSSQYDEEIYVQIEQLDQFRKKLS